MSRELDAFHEAGHAVAATALGVRVELALLRGYERAGELRDGWAGVVWHEQAEDPLATAIIALAGLEAERHLRAQHRPWSPEANAGNWWAQCLADGVQEHDTARAAVLNLSPDPGGAWWETVWRPTVELIAAHWPAIESVAYALHRRGRLTGEEVTELVEQVSHSAMA